MYPDVCSFASASTFRLIGAWVKPLGRSAAFAGNGRGRRHTGSVGERLNAVRDGGLLVWDIYALVMCGGLGEGFQAGGHGALPSVTLRPATCRAYLGAAVMVASCLARICQAHLAWGT